MKLCKDCKHYRAAPLQSPRCAVTVSPVDGRPAMTCFKARLPLQHCGELGDNFEPKQSHQHGALSMLARRIVGRHKVMARERSVAAMSPRMQEVVSGLAHVAAAFLVMVAVATILWVAAR